MKKLLFLISALVLVLLPLTLANAAEFRSSPDQNMTIAESERPNDLYVTGQSLTVNPPIKGDLTIAGGNIVINGTIGDSLFAAGGTINVRGNVGRHVRLAGGTVTISGNIGGDLFVAGGTIIIDKSSTIGGGLYVGGGTVTIDGTVKGDVRLAGGSVSLNGSTGSFRSYNSDLTIGSDAVINGDLTYHSSQVAKIDNDATITGETDFVKTANKNYSELRNFVAFTSLMILIGSILLGWLLFYLLPKRSRAIVEKATTSAPASIGIGLLAFIIAPIVGVMLMISVIGLPIAFLLFGLWMVLFIVGGIFSKIIIGSLIFRLFSKTKDYPLNIWVIIVGVVVGGLIGLIPILGALFTGIFFLLSLGAVVQVATSIFKPASETK